MNFLSILYNHFAKILNTKTCSLTFQRTTVNFIQTKTIKENSVWNVR